MERSHQFYIGGRWVTPQSPLSREVVDPSTAEPFATIAMGNAADAEAAILAARAAAPAGAATPLAERSALLRRIAAILGVPFSKLFEAQHGEQGPTEAPKERERKKRGS